MNRYDPSDLHQPSKPDNSKDATISKLLYHMQQMRESVPVNLKLKEELKQELIKRMQQMRSPQVKGVQAKLRFQSRFKRGGFIVSPILLIILITIYTLTNKGMQIHEMNKELLGSSQAEISYTGNQIAVLNDSIVEIVNEEGAVLSTISLPNYSAEKGIQWEHLSWSPADQMLAVAQNSDESGRIWLLSPSQASSRLLIEEKGTAFEEMAWSPDLRFLIATRSKGVQQELVKIDLTNSSTTLWGMGSQPAWSPDGKEIAYVKDGQIVISSISGEDIKIVGEGGESHLVWIASSKLIYLTKNPFELHTIELGDRDNGTIGDIQSIELPISESTIDLNFSLSADGMKILWIDETDPNDRKIYKIQMD